MEFNVKKLKFSKILKLTKIPFSEAILLKFYIIIFLNVIYNNLLIVGKFFIPS